MVVQIFRRHQYARATLDEWFCRLQRPPALNPAVDFLEFRMFEEQRDLPLAEAVEEREVVAVVSICGGKGMSESKDGMPQERECYLV